MDTALTQLLIFMFPYLIYKGSTYVLTTQTNLYKLQLFYLLNSYALHLQLTTYTIGTYLTVTYLCYCVSVFLCVHLF